MNTILVGVSVTLDACNDGLCVCFVSLFVCICIYNYLYIEVCVYEHMRLCVDYAQAYMPMHTCSTGKLLLHEYGQSCYFVYLYLYMCRCIYMCADM